MEYTDIRFEVRDGVAIITLNRPEHLNAYTGKMGEELGQAYRRCDGDDEIRAVVLTGAGKAFCAGADMTAGAGTFAKQNEPTFTTAGVTPPAWEVRKPVIAAVNGHAIGIGLTLALQCDMRILAKEGKYGIVQVRRGVMPDAYSHWTLPRIIGLERAAYVMLTGRTMTGEEVEQLGMALRVVPAAEVLPTTLEIARDITAYAAPLSVALTKRLLWESQNLTAPEVSQRETELHHHLMGKSDAIEGALAWIERRAPRWELSASKDWPEWPPRTHRAQTG